MKKETDPLLVKADAIPVGSGDIEQVHVDESTQLVDKSFGTRLQEVAAASFQLGLTAFGDSTLTVALVQDVVVEKGHWVDSETFMELFSLGQTLPGPLATQVLMSAAMVHAGPLGALLALIVWAFPGAALLTVLGGVLVQNVNTDTLNLWLSGVAPATVALVIFASVNFAKSLDPFGFGLAMISCVVSIFIDGDLNVAKQDTQFVFPVMLFGGAVLAIVDAYVFKIGSYHSAISTDSSTDQQKLDKITYRINMPIWGGLMILQFWLILLLLGIVGETLVWPGNAYMEIFARFYRMGSVVFGGAEAVLPMMTTELVPRWLSVQQFSHGLALAQASPGSLFNLAAYIGAVYTKEGGGKAIPNALLGVTAIYVPSYLFLLAGLPIWARLRRVLAFQALLKGVNAVAIGFMGAVCIFLWEGSILRASDAMILMICLGCVSYYQVAAPVVIAIAIALGIIFNEEFLDIAQKPYNGTPEL